MTVAKGDTTMTRIKYLDVAGVQQNLRETFGIYCSEIGSEELVTVSQGHISFLGGDGFLNGANRRRDFELEGVRIGAELLCVSHPRSPVSVCTSIRMITSGF